MSRPRRDPLTLELFAVPRPAAPTPGNRQVELQERQP